LPPWRFPKASTEKARRENNLEKFSKGEPETEKARAADFLLKISPTQKGRNKDSFARIEMNRIDYQKRRMAVIMGAGILHCNNVPKT